MSDLSSLPPDNVPAVVVETLADLLMLPAGTLVRVADLPPFDLERLMLAVPQHDKD